MSRRPGLRVLTALLAVAAVLTAGAPTVIRVRPGDSLWELARRHQTTVAALVDLNDLPGNGTIYAGQLLKLPGRPGPAYRTVERSYTVRSGDTLTLIARRHRVSVRTLIVRNKLPRSGQVLVGRRLAIPTRVRVGSAPAPVAGYNAGVRIPAAVQRSAQAHRRYLRDRPQPSRAQARRLVDRTARRYGVDPSLALAVAYHESGFQQRVVSPVDAIGIMQVLPSTGRAVARQHGRRLDLRKAEDNVVAGVLLLRQLVRATGTAPAALAGYYQGLGSVRARGLLPQTRAYVRNVAALRARFRSG